MTDNTVNIILPGTAKIQSEMLRHHLLKQAPVWDSLRHSLLPLADKSMRKAMVYREINAAVVDLIHDLENHINENTRAQQPKWLAEIAVALIGMFIDEYVTRLEAAASLSEHLIKLGFIQESRELAERVLVGIF